MTAAFKVRAEVAFSTTPLAASPAFVDLSAFLLAAGGRSVGIARGRSDEFAQVQPSRASFVLDNSDGRFTAGLASSPYFPNVKKGRRVRITARPWDNVNDRPTTSGNSVTNPGAETNTTGWSAVNAAITRTITAGQFNTGVAGFQFTVTAAGALAGILSGVTVPVVAGRAYTFAAQLKKAVNARNGALRVQFYRVDGTTATGAVQVGASVSVSTASFARATLAATAPVDAAFATVRPGTALAADAVATEVWWVDDIMCDEGASAGTFTTTAPDILYRFDGFVDEWPTEWADGGTGTYAVADITATDRLARLARARVLRNAIEETIFVDGPLAYWSLGDAAGTTAPASGVPGQPALTLGQLGAGGTATFGSATGPPTDGLTALQIAPVDSSNGPFFWAPLSMTVPASSDYSVECFYSTTSAGGDVFPTLITLAPTNVAPTAANILDHYAVGMDQTGHLRISGNFNNTPVAGAASADAVATNDGATHHVLLTFVQSTGVYTLYRDGVSALTVTDAAVHPAWDRVILGSSRGIIGAAPVTFSHVAIYATALSAARAAARAAFRTTAAAGDGEASGARVSRWATHLGITSTTVEAGVSTSVQFRDWTGKTPLEMLREVEKTENGLLFFDGQGRLVFHARSHRYNPTLAATLATDQYGADLTFRLDDFLLVNDVRVSRAGGGTFRAQNVASQTDYDVYASDETSITTDDNEASSAASWRANTYGSPLVRCGAVSVDLLTLPSLIPTVGALDLGSAVRLSGLPSQAPTSTVDLFVEAISEEIGLDVWSVKFVTSPVGPSASAWVLDSAAYSVLDSTTIPAY